MAILKCKMCGGDIELSADKTYGMCDSCGCTMTFPKVNDEQRAAAFNRGNHFRRMGEFDKALAVYERIVAEDETDAEAHWCCALCRFGIEYVEDPATFEWLPTCHRASFDSFMEDVDYLSAVEHSDGVTRRQYQRDAAKIAEVQRGILATSQNEEPFDVFICYKETDESGQRTRDSILAQDIYYRLTEQGRRVFFARITLEDKAGTEFEPYIFAALNSAKVMIAVGTKPEHFSAVWVKNEWSRFLSLMRKDRSRLLLPCYRDMDPYDLPEQLSVLQSYDMAKIGFLQDLIHGVNKVLDANASAPVAKQETVVVHAENGGHAEAFVKRGNMALEDGEWAKADEFFEQALNADAELGDAYLGKFFAEKKASDAKTFIQSQIRAAENCEREKREIFLPQDGRDALAEELSKNYDIDKQAIYKEFDQFSNVYLSKVAGREAALESIKRLLAEDRLLHRAKTFGAGAVSEMEEKLLPVLQRLVDEAEEEDAASIESIKAAHEEFLAKKKQEISARCEKLRAKAHEINELCSRILSLKEDLTLDESQLSSCPQIHELLNEGRLLMARRNELSNAIASFTAQYDKLSAEIEDLNVQRSKCGLFQTKEKKNIDEQVQKLNDQLHRIRIEIRQGKEKQSEVEKNREAVSEKQREILRPHWERQRRELIESILKRIDAIENPKYRVMLNNLVFSMLSNPVAQRDLLRFAPDAWVRKCRIILSRNNMPRYSMALMGARKDGMARMTNSESYETNSMLLFKGIYSYDIQNLNMSLPGFDRIDLTKHIVAVSAGSNYTVGLKSDGTVVACGDGSYGRCDVSKWTDIVAVSAGGHQTVGLKSDGTVLAVGENNYGQCNVSKWTDIIAVSAGAYHIVGLKSDGTVVTTKNKVMDFGQYEVSGWTDIVAVSAGSEHTVGLKSDGTVVAVGLNVCGQCNVSGWTDIVAVSAGSEHTVGLKSDGTVIATKYTGNMKLYYGQCNVSGWTDIVAVSAGGLHTIGLKSDGTVVAVGWNRSGRCGVSGWTDIVAVSAGSAHTVGMKSDGTVVAVGDNVNGQCNVSGWRDIKLPASVQIN